MRSGDIAKNGERSELAESSFHLKEKTNQFYGFSIYIPHEQLTDCGSECGKWRTLMQWHVTPNDGYHPMFRLALYNGKLSFIYMTSGLADSFEYDYAVEEMSFPPDQWLNFVVQFYWSGDDMQGFANIWYNNTLIGSATRVGYGYFTNVITEGVYWKHGIYRQTCRDTDIIYFDELRRGSTKAEVAPYDRDCNDSGFLPVASFLLASNSTNNGRPYSPINKSLAVSTENTVTLTASSWQTSYSIQDTFCQMAIKSDATVKTKFGQIVTDGNYGKVEWFDVERGTTQSTQSNGAPFNVNSIFPEYNFTNCHDPGDDDDIWTCQVQIPGYN